MYVIKEVFACIRIQKVLVLIHRKEYKMSNMFVMVLKKLLMLLFT